MTQVTIRNCAKTFGDGTKALLPTSLSIEPGEILGLLGPSGCGKTTMLRIMAGLEKPDAGGSVRFDDTDVTRVPIERRGVGMVFQSYALFPNMTVADNIGYGLRVRGIGTSERKHRVDEVMAFCRLKGLSGRAIHQLSGGQRQRVALARAVAPKPKVLLLDEPLSALDAALRESLRDELATILRDLNITAVFVTHDQAEALAIADRVAVMRAGRIEQLAPPKTLYDQPETAFVATFIGGANRLTGERGEDQLTCPGGTIRLPEAGRSVQFFARPEVIKLSVPESATLTGRVSHLSYQGHLTRLTVTGATDTPLTILVFGSVQPAVGETVGLAIEPEDIIVIPEETEVP